MEFDESHFKSIVDREKREREFYLAQLKERPLAISEPPTAPDQLRVITGSEGLIYDTTQIFFDEVLDYLGVVPRARGLFTKIESYSLAHPYITDTTDPAHIIPEYSLDILNAGERPAASCLTTRDYANFVIGSWSSYLTPKLVETIQERLNPIPNSHVRINLYD